MDPPNCIFLFLFGGGFVEGEEELGGVGLNFSFLFYEYFLIFFFWL